MGSKTLREFLMKFMEDLKKICGIDNDILRNKLSTILENYVNSIMNEFIENYCKISNLNEFIENGCEKLKNSVNKTRSYFLKILRDCSSESDKDNRNKLQNHFLEVIQSKLDIINQRASSREYNESESFRKKIRLSSPYSLNSSNSERKKKRDDNIDFLINFFKIKEHEEIYCLEYNKKKSKDTRLLIRCRCGTECNPDNNHYWQAEAESKRALEIVYFYNNLNDNDNDNDFTVIEHLVEIIKNGKKVYIYMGILTPLNQLLVIIISRFKNKINLMSQSDEVSYKNCVNFIDKYINKLINKSSEIRQSQRDFAHELENHDYGDTCTPIDPTDITIISVLENESNNESNPYEIGYSGICTTIEPANYITYGKRNRPYKLSSSSSKDSMIP